MIKETNYTINVLGDKGKKVGMLLRNAFPKGVSNSIIIHVDKYNDHRKQLINISKKLLEKLALNAMKMKIRSMH